MTAQGPHILLMANGILGWKTYSQQVAAVMASRADLRSAVHWRRPSGLSTAFVKRHDVSGRLLRWLRCQDPIHAYRGRLGADIRRQITEHAPEIVHFASHWPSGALLDMADAPPFTVSLDCTRANIERDFGFGIWTLPEMEREADLLRSAARIYPMSHWAADSLVGDYGIDPARIRIIPPAQNLTAFKPKRSHDGPPNIVFIGNDFVRKGGPRLVEWVQGPLAGRCHLHIVSADPMAMVRGPDITAHGRVPHADLIARLLPKMDMMCLPTELDMSPHVLVEAAAARLPVVASRLGGIADIVLNGRSGILADIDSDADFIAALTQLIEAPDLRRCMGEAAFRHARTAFDADTVYSQMIDEICAAASMQDAAIFAPYVPQGAGVLNASRQPG